MSRVHQIFTAIIILQPFFSPCLVERDIKLMVSYLCIGQDYSVGSMGKFQSSMNSSNCIYRIVSEPVCIYLCFPRERFSVFIKSSVYSIT